MRQNETRSCAGDLPGNGLGKTLTGHTRYTDPEHAAALSAGQRIHRAASLSLVAKQDLWWQRQTDVRRHYEQHTYGTEVQKIITQRGHQHFRHEFAYASLVIGNFVTGMKELLQPNSAGFDHHQYVQSLRHLFETIDSLRKWEAKNA